MICHRCESIEPKSFGYGVGTGDSFGDLLVYAGVGEPRILSAPGVTLPITTGEKGGGRRKRNQDLDSHQQ